MKINISSLDNSLSLNITGETKRVPVKDGFVKKRTLGGKNKIRWNVRYNKIEVNIQYMNENQYDILEQIWYNTDGELVVKAETGEVYIGVIVDSSLSSINEDYDIDGNKFRYGTINIED